MIIYLVERKADGRKFVMVGDLKNLNVGSGRYLYDLVSDSYQYAIETPYGLRSNVSTDIKYNAKQFRVVHQTAM